MTHERRGVLAIIAIALCAALASQLASNGKLDEEIYPGGCRWERQALGAAGRTLTGWGSRVNLPACARFVIRAQPRYAGDSTHDR
jgi:hypothetical protein